MLSTMRTLFLGASARAEEQVRDQFAIELIEQKLREAQNQLKTAKVALAHLIQRERGEARQIETITVRVKDMTGRAEEALAAGREDMAGQAAEAIADMENDLARRRETLAGLELRIAQLKTSIERANRRIMDLKQGAIAAKAVRREQDMQKKLGRHLGGSSAMDEAESLIADVMGRDDPFEQNQILAEIDRGLDHTSLDTRMADAGFGPKGRVSASDVLARLSPKPTT